ncbi:MAG: transcriptional regulator [Acidimicrobiales bacterium]|nr:helix-turn-helix transcriptional regulator [Hyphomonadaceae bacterium]RZV41426.1 MAG: transcriptional regulator [Acidimicrobiales bacterium]
MEQLDIIKSMSALAHDGRLTLMRRLIQAGPDGVGAGELGKFADIGATTASAQLLVLSNAGLVSSKREGRHVTYFADYTRLRSVLKFLMHDCCGNRAEICCGLDAEV